MNEVVELLKSLILNEEIIYGVLSNLRKKSEDGFSKVDIKPVLIKDEIKFQFTYSYKDKVLHENRDSAESIYEIEELLNEKFRQGMIFTKEADYQILISKKER